MTQQSSPRRGSSHSEFGYNAPVNDARKVPHPALYAVLIIPFGATSGFVSVALAFLATKRGLTIEQGAGLVAVSMFPNVWKFFWAPVADKTLTRKRWYVLSTIISIIGVFAMATIPLSPALLTVMSGVILLTSIASTFTGFAVESIVAHVTPAAQRGSVSGWFQAGNLGGAGLGGGLGLFLLEHMESTWLAGSIMSATLLLCLAALPSVPDVPREASGDSIPEAVKAVAVDMWSVIKARDGFLAAVLCFVPIGTGAAQAVLTQAEVAAAWGAGEREVTLVQGFLTGSVSMVGCLAAGWICTRLSPRIAYAAFGLLMAVITALMAISPRTTNAYIGFNLAYAFVTGLCYAAFSAFTLEAIGKGHAATKYNGFASLSNTPIWYMGLLLATAQTKWNASGMLFTESVMGVVGVLVFLVLSVLLRAKKTAPEASA